MEVTITQFRRDLFNLVEQAMNGTEVYVTHKGKRRKIQPDQPPKDRLDRISALQVINSLSPDLDDRPDKDEMRRQWEKDWASL